MNWFVKSVLPGLVIGLIGVVAGYFLGLFQSLADMAFESVGSRWIPQGTMLLMAENRDCPKGWDDVGELGLLYTPKDAGDFEKYFTLLEGTDGYGRILSNTCVKP